MSSISKIKILNETYDVKDAVARGDLVNKANIVSPAFTGAPTAPTATAGTNNTQIATTAFVQAAIGDAIEASY